MTLLPTARLYINTVVVDAQFERDQGIQSRINWPYSHVTSPGSTELEVYSYTVEDFGHNFLIEALVQNGLKLRYARACVLLKTCFALASFIGS